MRIAAVTVTCERITLLARALKSIKEQTRNPDLVYVISNSKNKTFLEEQRICAEFGFSVIKNHRTENYAGALNTAIEEIVKQHGVKDDIYFASLDDDDIWLPDYLKEIENSNTTNFDLLAANYLRSSDEENLLMNLPNELSEKDFLAGNPGIVGSNTFIRLKTLLKAGCFDEALHSAVDRDLLVRVFQQRPSFKVIQKHLVTTYTDKNRERITTNHSKKKKGFQVFYYKYQHLMNANLKERFFERARNFFSIEKDEIEIRDEQTVFPESKDVKFKNKGNYQFVIGFIAGDEVLAERIARQICEKNIPVELVLIIEDVPKGKSLDGCEKLFHSKNIPYAIIKYHQWKENLDNGYYGSYFKRFSKINSIPLGRTILQHHLFTKTTELERPVYWIIDDDMLFSTISVTGQQVDIFDLINENIDNVDGIVGGMSYDPPVPTLSCIRTQLLDLEHSTNSNGTVSDLLNLQQKNDYYYDLSDLHSDHLEVPIYHKSVEEKQLAKIFSGKALSRPALQQELKSENKTITRRGGNTLVFSREMLQYYPVLNLEVNRRFARRGDLLWTFFNQVVSGRIILEHTFSLNHDKSVKEFDLRTELDKSAYDIIGYAFNKGFLRAVEKIKEETNPQRPKDIFEKLIQEDYYSTFLDAYTYRIKRRKARFLMNYFRIIGLTNLLSEKFEAVNHYRTQFSDENKLIAFDGVLNEALEEKTLKTFFAELTIAIWTFSKSIIEDRYKTHLKNYFGLKGNLRKLGGGAEGFVFTDDNFVYKCYFSIRDNEWNFMREKSHCFAGHWMLEEIECFTSNGIRFIRYPYYPFKPLEKVKAKDVISFLKFCKRNDFVFTNIKMSNFIQTNSGTMKLIDYGKSFEQFTEAKFLNSIKRTYLLLKSPNTNNEDFQKLTAQINAGQEPEEIRGWENLWRTVEPRRKENILDNEIVSIIKKLKPKRILDYGAGKCKTAKQLQTETQADVSVFDINAEVLKKHCGDLGAYHPGDASYDGRFDVALLNLVLCEIDNKTVQEILGNISKALVENGKLIVSVCNPDFAHIHKTEFQNRNSLPKTNTNEEIITKTCVYTGNNKTEFYRPTEKYIKLFEANRFSLIESFDTEGTNIETLELASDFKVFILLRI
jgi:SAM-dependent methyltransferase